MMPMMPRSSTVGTRPPMAGKMPMNTMMASRRPGGMKSGGMSHRCHERADGCAEKGHTKGKIVMCKGGMHK